MKEFGENRYSQPERRRIQADNLLDKSQLDFKSFFRGDNRQTAAAILRLANAEAGRTPSILQDEETPLQVFGILLSVERRKQNLEVEALAGQAGLDAERLLAIELGLASFEQVVETLPRLAGALGEKYPELSARLAELTLR